MNKFPAWQALHMESFQTLWKYKIWGIKMCQEKIHINSENWHFSSSPRSYLLHAVPTIPPLKAIQHHKTWCLLPAPTQVDTLIFTQFPSLHPIKPKLFCPCFSSIQSFWIQRSSHPTLTEIRSGFQCSFTTKSTIKSALNCSQTRECSLFLDPPPQSTTVPSSFSQHSSH